LKQGLILFLNGTSSSGKTSISMELKNQKEIPFHHFSIEDEYDLEVNTEELSPTECAEKN